MDSVFESLSLIIAVAAGLALLMRLIGQPLIIGHIVTGIIVGPAVFRIGNTPDVFNVFSEIGIALLLFIIGLSLNPRVIKDVGKTAGGIGAIQVIIIGILGWAAGIWLNLSSAESLFFGIALAFSSTIIALKLLSDKHETSRLYGRITTGILLTQDIIATFALLFAASASSHEFAVGSLLGVVVKGLVLGAAIYWFANSFLPRWSKQIATSQEFLFLFAIGWALGVSALFVKAGLSLEIGALFGGICLSSLPYTEEISARLRPVRDFFVVVFFITLGTGLSFSNLPRLLPAILVGSLIVMAIKPIVVLIGMELAGYSKRTSFKTASAVGQASEFSVVLAVLGVNHDLIGQDVAVALTFITLISIAGSAYLILFSDKLYAKTEKYLDYFMRGRPRLEHEKHKSYELVLFGYQKGGHEFINTFKQLGRSFVVVDYDPEIIESLEKQKIDCLYGDATDPELLEEAGADKAKLVISAVTDHKANIMLLDYIARKNPSAVIICQADYIKDALELYDHGANYVMLPHYIGSEQIGAFIKKSELKRSTFNKYRSRHLSHLRTQQKKLQTISEEKKEDLSTRMGSSIVKNFSGLKSRN